MGTSFLFVTYILLLFFSRCSYSYGNEFQKSSIKFVAIIFRHGDRSPIRTYSTDPHKDYKWPGGSGAISPKGARQLYNLGTSLRKKYVTLLPKDGYYSKNSLIVKSSHHDRCIKSAKSFLVGFLQLDKNATQSSISREPITINLIPSDQDNMLSHEMRCDEYIKLLKKMESKPHARLRAMKRKYASTLAFVSNQSGTNLTISAQENKLESLYSILAIEKAFGLSLPEWTNEVFPDKLLLITRFNSELLTEFPVMKKIKGGPFITEVVNAMITKIEENISSDQNITVYSAHDLSLLIIMGSLNIQKQISGLPEFGACFAFELHKQTDLDSYEVQIWYHRSSYDKTPLKVKIPNCDDPCSFKQFFSSVQDVLITDFTKLCKSSTE